MRVAFAMQLKCRCNAIKMQLKCICIANEMQTQCECNASAMQLKCICNANTMQIQCTCNVLAMQMQSICNANAMHSKCKCNANSSGTYAQSEYIFSYARSVPLVINLILFLYARPVPFSLISDVSYLCIVHIVQYTDYKQNSGSWKKLSLFFTFF